jgi:hypothetical protein
MPRCDTLCPHMGLQYVRTRNVEQWMKRCERGTRQKRSSTIACCSFRLPIGCPVCQVADQGAWSNLLAIAYSTAPAERSSLYMLRAHKLEPAPQLIVVAGPVMARPRLRGKSGDQRSLIDSRRCARDTQVPTRNILVWIRRYVIAPRPCPHAQTARSGALVRSLAAAGEGSRRYSARDAPCSRCR